MSILCFAENGKFLFRIHAVGKGPGEYQLLSSMLILENRQELWTQCRMSRRILIYNLDGTLIREESTDRTGIDLVQFNESDILVYDEERHYLSNTDSINGGVFLAEKHFKRKNQLLNLPTESVYYQLKNKNNFSVHNDSCYFLSPSDSLICFPPNLNPIVTGVFNFGVHHLSESLKRLPVQYQNFSKVLNSGKVIWKENLLVSSKSIFFNIGCF